MANLSPEKYFSSAGIFILSSRWEGFANVLVEALFYNLKIISTNCKYGPSEILENGKYGVLLKTNNDKEMHDSMIDMIKSKSSFNGYLRSLDFEISKIGDIYLEYFFERN